MAAWAKGPAAEAAAVAMVEAFAVEVAEEHIVVEPFEALAAVVKSCEATAAVVAAEISEVAAETLARPPAGGYYAGWSRQSAPMQKWEVATAEGKQRSECWLSEW